MYPFTTLYVGLDVHKESIAVAYVPDEPQAEAIYVGPIGPRPADIDDLIRRFKTKASQIIFAEETGPCGYGIYRHLQKKGCRCLPEGATEKSILLTSRLYSLLS